MAQPTNPWHPCGSTSANQPRPEPHGFPPTGYGFNQPRPEPQGNAMGPMWMGPPVPTQLSSTWTSPHVALQVVGQVIIGGIALMVLAAGIAMIAMDQLSGGLVIVLPGLVLLLHAIWSATVGRLTFRHQVELDGAGIRRTGTAGWETRWCDVERIRLGTSGLVTRMVVIEKPQVAHKRRNWWLNWTFGSPTNSLMSAVESSKMPAIMAMALARGIPVEQR